MSATETKTATSTKYPYRFKPGQVPDPNRLNKGGRPVGSPHKLPRSAREAAALLKSAGEKELWLSVLKPAEREKTDATTDAQVVIFTLLNSTEREGLEGKLLEILEDLWDCAYKAGSATVRVRMEALKYLSDRRDGKTPVMPAQQLSKKQDSRLQEVMAKVLGSGAKATKPEPVPLIEDAKPTAQPEQAPEPALLPIADPVLAEHDALRAKSALEQRLIEHQQRKANELASAAPAVADSAPAIVPDKVMVQDHNQHQVDVTGTEV